MFTHLHLHTEYSLLDGLTRIPQLMDHVKEMGQEAVAMTDHGNLYGAIDFYREAQVARHQADHRRRGATSRPARA